MGEHFTRIHRQFLKEGIFSGGQFHFRAGASYLSFSKIDGEVTAGDGRPHGRYVSCFGAPKDSADPCHEFTGPERLDDIVIGSEVKALHLILFIATGAEHNYGNL